MDRCVYDDPLVAYKACMSFMVDRFPGFRF